MNNPTVRVLLWLCLLVAGSLAGCQDMVLSPPSSSAPVVPVSRPVQRKVTDYADFTGRTDAVETVSIRARVTGYLQTMRFREGSEVKQGDLLFEIDPRPYQAQLDQAQGQVEVNEASLKLAIATYGRDIAVAKSVAGAVSKQQLDQDLAAENEAAARLKSAKASTEVYKLNLEFTKVISPINGMVSRYFYTRGNLVNQDQTLLTTIVSLDPIYAYFDMDEPTLLRIRQGINEGRVERVKDSSEIPVYLGLQGEDGYPHRGNFNFINNVVNPSTGSVSARGKFDNPKSDKGIRILMPGMFVRIRLPIGQPHAALLVIDRALASDQGLKYLYVLDADNKVQYRRVRIGALQEDGLRVIEDGLAADDWVVVGGLPQVRPRMQIQPDRQPMPSLASNAPTTAANGSQPTAEGAKRQKQPGKTGP